MNATLEQINAQAQILLPTQQQQVLDFMRSLAMATHMVTPPGVSGTVWKQFEGSILPEDLVLTEQAIEHPTIAEHLMGAVRDMPREQQLEMLNYIYCLPWYKKTAIRELEMVQTRPTMFMHPVSPTSTNNFLAGFEIGYSVFGSKITQEIRAKATRKRGWKFSAEDPIGQMQESGYTDVQIIDELFQIHIAALRIIERNTKKKFKESK